MTKRYKVMHPDGLMLLSTGDSFRRGEYVTGDGLPPGMAEQLAADGIIEPVADPDWNATDVAALLAARHGLDLTEVEGSGQDGRIVKKDVEELMRG